MTINDLLTRRDILATIKNNDVCLDPENLGGTKPLDCVIKDDEAPYIIVTYYNERPIDVFARLYNARYDAYFDDSDLNTYWLEMKDRL